MEAQRQDLIQLAAALRKGTQAGTGNLEKPQGRETAFTDGFIAGLKKELEPKANCINYNFKVNVVKSDAEGAIGSDLTISWNREGQAYCLYLQVKYLYHDYDHYANSTQTGSKELKEYWKGCAPWFNAAYMSKAKDTMGTYQALAMQDFVNTDLKATPPCISKAVFFLFGDKDSGNTSPCIVDVQTIAAKCGAENPRALKREHLRDLTPQQLQAIYEAKVPILKNLFSANDPLLDFLRA
ncbi:hypothetical protein FVEG_13801 [Fusarium verticillioides 7600]|uniref:Uncharacterized protein n=1 Tax=Gibberella moniliformis (strain M3125 / FGSC 7600) TaxID=334819 RepID=W7N7Y4_GIBM7|nr:hypothetical protein FVEG_13801 [Fusarium verticillioides 7600]EWG55859.1 hypothetical protein FVEG_13801 [Fusarium verticillioides 7600]